MEHESLSDILKGPSSASEPVEAPADVKPAEPVATETASATTSVVKDEAAADPAETPTQRNEKGQFVKGEEKPSKEPVSREVAGVIDERKKRQAAEAIARDRDAEIRELRKSSSVAKAPEPGVDDFYTDPSKATAEVVRRELAPYQERLTSQSIENARLRYGDEFNRFWDAFYAESKKNPGLKQQMESAENPGQFIVDAGYWFSEMEPHGGSLSKRDEAKFGEYKTQLAERDSRIKALESELTLAKKTQTELEAVPTSLNRQASAGLSRGESTDADDLRSIVRFGNNPR